MPDFCDTVGDVYGLQCLARGEHTEGDFLQICRQCHIFQSDTVTETVRVNDCVRVRKGKRSHVFAESEGIASDEFYILGQGKGLKSVAPCECVRFNALDGGGDDDVRKLSIITERCFADGDGSVGYCIASGSSCGITHESLQILCKKHSINRCKCRICTVNGDVSQTFTVSEYGVTQ